jgi:hypothetical protein
VLADRAIVECLTCWCVTQPIGFKRLTYFIVVCVRVCVGVICVTHKPLDFMTNHHVAYPFPKPGVSIHTPPQHDRQFHALDPTHIRLVSTRFCLTVVRESHVHTKFCFDKLRRMLEKSYTLPTELSKWLTDNTKLLLRQVCGVFAKFLYILMLVEFCNLVTLSKYRKSNNIPLRAWFNVLSRYTVVGSDLHPEFIVVQNGICIWVFCCCCQ